MYAHNGPIHDIQPVPNEFVGIGLNGKPVSKMRCAAEENLTKFATCSSDRTIRFWNLIDPTIQTQKQAEISQCLAKNAYSKDMSKIIFITSQMRSSLDQGASQSGPTSPYDHFKAAPLDRKEDGQVIDQNEETVGKLRDMVDSIRCIRLSPDGKHLASGDELGNIRVHSVESQADSPQIRFLESHEAEVISLSYSTPMESAKGGAADSRYLLASGGRDKTVLVYDSETQYEAFTQLDHHSSTITALHFNEYSVDVTKSKSNAAQQRNVELITGSADRNLITKSLDLDRFDACTGSDELCNADADPQNPLFRLAST